MLDYYVAVVVRYVVFMNKVNYGGKRFANRRYGDAIAWISGWEVGCGIIWVAVYDRLIGKSTEWTKHTRHLIFIGAIVVILNYILLNKKDDPKYLQLTSFKQIGTRSQRIVSAIFYWVLLVLTAAGIFLNFYLG